jgi:hypothetical protein
MIIGVAGFIGSGKDTVADYLTTFHGFKKLSFASSLKDAVAAVFGWERELLEGATKHSREWRDQIDPWWAERLGIPNLTPRWVLQYWGTEVCRHGFHDAIWIASLENRVRQSKDNVVITDCRFSNEIKAIKNANGITMRVNRGERPEWYDDALAYNLGPNNNSQWALGKAKLDKLRIHASEYSGVGLSYDYQVDNNHTIDALHKTVESIINR